MGDDYYTRVVFDNIGDGWKDLLRESYQTSHNRNGVIELIELWLSRLSSLPPNQPVKIIGLDIYGESLLHGPLLSVMGKHVTSYNNFNEWRKNKSTLIERLRSLFREKFEKSPSKDPVLWDKNFRFPKTNFEEGST